MQQPVQPSSRIVPSSQQLGRGTFALMVAALTTAQAVGTIGGLITPAIAPAVAQGYGVPVYLIGYQASLFYVGMLTAMMFGTNFNLRWGGCRTSQFGLLLVALGAVTLTIGSIPLLVPASIIMGIGYGALTPASSHILLRFTPARHRNIVFSLKQTGVPLGVVIAATAGPALTLAAGWQMTLLACAAVSVVTAAVLQTGHARLDKDRSAAVPLASSPLEPVRVMWGTRSLRLLALSGAMLATSQVIIHNYTVAMFYEQLGMPLVQAGLMLTMSQVGGVFGRLFWGWLADRTGECLRVMMVLAGVLAASALAISTLQWGWPVAWAYVLFFVLGATASGYHGAFLAEIARLSPSGRVSAGTGGTLVVTNTSSIIMPIIFANVFAAIHSYSLTFGLLAIPATTAIFLLRAARRAQAAAK
jgi:MFS family permease